jgi:hypothetical protein
MTTLSLTTHVRRRIAVAAEVDPRTVKKFCAGKLGPSMARDRIERALRAVRLLPSTTEQEKTQ